MTWDVANLISREYAEVKIKAMAAAEGYTVFKVYYDGTMIVNPSDLPEQVDMDKVTIGQKADQA